MSIKPRKGSGRVALRWECSSCHCRYAGYWECEACEEMCRSSDRRPSLREGGAPPSDAFTGKQQKKKKRRR